MNSPKINKTAEQLYAEFKQRQQAREQARAAEQQALLDNSFIPINEDDIEEFKIQQMSFQQKSSLVSKTKTALACSLIRNALLRQLQVPSQLSLGLCMHPCFSLLFQSEQRQKLLASQVPLNWQTFAQPSELHQLSHQLKVALPDLAADFENETGLSEVWQEAVLVLLRSPLPCSLLDNLGSTDFAAQVLTSCQKPAAMPLNHLPVIDKTLLYPCRWLVGIYSWFVLRVLIKKLKK